MTIWITGHFGQRNIGDEAILASVLDHRPSWASAKILTPRDATLERNIHRIPSCLEPPLDPRDGKYGLIYGAGYWLKNWPWMIGDVFKKKGCIIAGGTFVHEHVHGKGESRQCRISALKKIGCKVALLAIGVDKLSTPGEREAARRLVSDEVDYCSVRDEDSAMALEDCGVNPGRFHRSADVVFALARPRIADKCLEFNSLSQASIAVNLRPLFDRDQYRGSSKSARREAYFNASCELVSQLCRHVRQVNLFPFSPGDVSFLRDVGEHCGVKVRKLEVDPRDAIARMVEFDAIVGMRYHAIVLGLMSGIVCLPIPYASKLATLSREMRVDCEDLIVSDGVLLKDQPLSPYAVVEQLNTVWERRGELLPEWGRLCKAKSEAAAYDIERCWNAIRP